MAKARPLQGVTLDWKEGETFVLTRPNGAERDNTKKYHWLKRLRDLGEVIFQRQANPGFPAATELPVQAIGYVPEVSPNFSQFERSRQLEVAAYQRKECHTLDSG